MVDENDARECLSVDLQPKKKRKEKIEQPFDPRMPAKRGGNSNNKPRILIEIFVDIIRASSRELRFVPTIMSFQPLAEFDEHLWVDSRVRVRFMKSNWLPKKRKKKKEN